MICEEESPDYAAYWLCDICGLAYPVDSKEWADTSKTGYEHVCVHCMNAINEKEEE